MIAVETPAARRSDTCDDARTCDVTPRRAYAAPHGAAIAYDPFAQAQRLYRCTDSDDGTSAEQSGVRRTAVDCRSSSLTATSALTSHGAGGPRYRSDPPAPRVASGATGSSTGSLARPWSTTARNARRSVRAVSSARRRSGAPLSSTPFTQRVGDVRRRRCDDSRVATPALAVEAAQHPAEACTTEHEPTPTATQARRLADPDCMRALRAAVPARDSRAIRRWPHCGDAALAIRSGSPASARATPGAVT